MDDELSELLRSLKAAEDVLQSVNSEPEHEGTAEPDARPKPTASHADEERKVALGDVAKARKDYEREPLDRS